MVLVSDQKNPKRMWFRNFNGSPENPARSCDGPTTMPPPCHPSATNHHPTPLGHETHDFLHVAINNYLVFSFWVWDQKTIYTYILPKKNLRPTRPQCKNKKHVFSKKRRMLTSSTSRSWIKKTRLRIGEEKSWSQLSKDMPRLATWGVETAMDVNTSSKSTRLWGVVPRRKTAQHWVSGKGEQKSLRVFLEIKYYIWASSFGGLKT